MPNKEKGKSSKEYYDSNPESKRKKDAYQKQYNKKPEQVKKRVELTALNRKRGTYGNGDGLDVAHTKNGTKLQKQSVNRGSKTAMPGDRRSRGGKK